MSENMNIVVLGGSFNPPTLAHEKLMKTAMSAVDAKLGLFVPSSNNYVSRKMSKAKNNNQVYSFYDREHMLNIICDKYNNMKVDASEYEDDGRGHTYETLCKIQAKYPDANIYFICGADKLSIIPFWNNVEKLLRQFYFVVTTRQGDNPHDRIKDNTLLDKYRNKFIIVEQASEIDNISSTEVRKLINKNSKDVYNMCDKFVVDYILTL